MPQIENLSSPVTNLSADDRLAMHFSMLRVRRVEEGIAARYSEQEMRCPTHFCVGQEAVPVGISAHLTPYDYVFSGHRSHGHYLAKGGDLKAMLCELYGKEAGCARGRGGSQHLIDLEAGFVASAPILAGTLPIAVGAVYGSSKTNPERISVVYFGDGATEEGAFHEAMNFAAVKNLPVVFVCENNLYSVHSDFSVRQPPGRSIAKLGPAHGIKSQTADGNDIVTVWNLGQEAVLRARSGDGPTLLEFMTYRWLEHCGPNDDAALKYRTKEEISAWQSKCPIVRSDVALRRDGLLTNDLLKDFERKISEEIETAFEYAKSMPFPDPADLMTFTLPEKA